VIDIVKNNLDAMQEICQKHQVISLYLFGSTANPEKFNDQSDIDFVYEIDTQAFEQNTNLNYDDVDNLEGLGLCLSTSLNKKVDMIPYRNIHNRIFKKEVDETRVLIYGR